MRSSPGAISSTAWRWASPPGSRRPRKLPHSRRAIRRCCADCAGQHAGSFEAAHAFARDRARFAVESLPAEEQYDLVVVGGGISGLAAAWFYRRARGAQARILILDNHDDFGGHAKRNEFMLDGRLVIGYGGSQSIDSPNAWWSETGKGLLRELGVDVRRFETAFERNLYSSLGLSRGDVLRARSVRARSTWRPAIP